MVAIPLAKPLRALTATNEAVVVALAKETVGDRNAGKRCDHEPPGAGPGVDEPRGKTRREGKDGHQRNQGPDGCDLEAMGPEECRDDDCSRVLLCGDGHHGDAQAKDGCDSSRRPPLCPGSYAASVPSRHAKSFASRLPPPCDRKGAPVRSLSPYDAAREAPHHVLLDEERADRGE